MVVVINGERRKIPKYSKSLMQKKKEAEKKARVAYLVGQGCTATIITEKTGFDRKTVDRYIPEVLAEGDVVELQKQLPIQIMWAKQQAAFNYDEATDPKDKCMWLTLFNNILRTESMNINKAVTLIQNNTQINIKPDIGLFIKALDKKVEHE
jgi:hypothetical protein